jgi:UBX domain
VQEVISASVIFWQKQNTQQDGVQYCDRYKVQVFPHIALIDPRTGGEIWINKRKGKMSSCDFIDTLTDVCERNSLANDAVKSKSSSKEDAARMLKQYQQVNGVPSQKAAPAAASSSSSDVKDTSSSSSTSSGGKQLSEDEQMALAIAQSMSTAATGSTGTTSAAAAAQKASANTATSSSNGSSSKDVVVVNDDDDSSSNDSDVAFVNGNTAAASSNQSAAAAAAGATSTTSVFDSIQLLAEPTAADAAKPIRVRIRLTNGAMKSRCFHSTENVSAIYKYVHNEMQSDETLLAEMIAQSDTPDSVKFDLKTAYPSASIKPKWSDNIASMNGCSLTMVWLS